MVNKFFAACELIFVRGISGAWRAGPVEKRFLARGQMMRTVLTYVSMLAIGAMTLAAFAVLLPWMQGRAGAAISGTEQFHLESGIVGLAVGLLLGILSRYNWGDIPRRIVNWVLIRERQFFYYVLIAGCIGVLLFY